MHAKKTGLSGKTHLHATSTGAHAKPTNAGIAKVKVAGPKKSSSMVHSRTVTKKTSTPKAVKK